MTRRTRHLTWTGASVAIAIALALAASAAAQAGSREEAPPASAARGVFAVGGHPQRQADAATRPGGLASHDAMAAVAMLAAVILMGLRGDVVVGGVIAGVAAVLGAGTRLVTGKPKRRAWADWPSPAVARTAQKAGSARRSAVRKRNSVDQGGDHVDHEALA